MRKFLILGTLCFGAVTPANGLLAEDTDPPTLLAYLGLSAADGKTTVGEGAAAVEGSMLVSALALKAVSEIQANITTTAGSNPVILLGKDEKFSLVPKRQVERAILRLEEEKAEFLSDVADIDCDSKPAKNSWKIFGLDEIESVTEPKPKFDFRFSDVLGASRFSTGLTAVPVDLSLEMIKAAMQMGGGSVKWVSPGDILDAEPADAYRNRLEAIEKDVKKYAGKRCSANEDVGKGADAILAASADLMASKDGAPSLIDQAGQASAIVRNGATPKILRIDVSKAGGTLVNSSNLLTTIGFPALNIRGGMVVTYRLVDPATGANEAAGIVTCSYGDQLLISVNRKAPDPNNPKAKCTIMAKYP